MESTLDRNSIFIKIFKYVFKKKPLQLCLNDSKLFSSTDTKSMSSGQLNYKMRLLYSVNTLLSLDNLVIKE